VPLIAFAALAAAHLFDFVSFIVMTGRHGIAAELNPIVVALAEGYGLPGLTVAKIAAVLLLGSVFLVLAPQRRRLASSVMLIGIAAGVLGGISNLATT
jgi:hypothetical protein